MCASIDVHLSLYVDTGYTSSQVSLHEKQVLSSLLQAFQHDLPHELHRSFLSSEKLKLLSSLTNEHLNTTDCLAPSRPGVLQSIVHIERGDAASEKQL